MKYFDAIIAGPVLLAVVQVLPQVVYADCDYDFVMKLVTEIRRECSSCQQQESVPIGGPKYNRFEQLQELDGRGGPKYNRFAELVVEEIFELCRKARLEGPLQGRADLLRLSNRQDVDKSIDNKTFDPNRGKCRLPFPVKAGEKFPVAVEFAKAALLDAVKTYNDGYEDSQADYKGNMLPRIISLDTLANVLGIVFNTNIQKYHSAQCLSLFESRWKSFFPSGSPTPADDFIKRSKEFFGDLVTVINAHLQKPK